MYRRVLLAEAIFFGILMIVFLAICASSSAFEQDDFYIGFENNSDSLYFYKSNCDIEPSIKGNGKFALMIGPINSRKSSSIYAFVCGPGTIDFKWMQPSSIADLIFYAEGCNEPLKTCPKSDILTSPGPYNICSGIHKIIWEYNFKSDAGLPLANEALTSIGWIDDIHLNGLKFCNQSIPYQSAPELPYVSGPMTTSVGILCSFRVLSRDPNYDDQVKYIFEWGDGLRNETGFALERERIESHAWITPGSYKLRILAKDNHNGTSLPYNMTIEVLPIEDHIFYPGNDLNDKINNSPNTVFYLARGHYDKSIYINNFTNNIIIKSEDDLSSPVIDSLNKDYCIKIYNTSNITLEGLSLSGGNTCVIVENSKYITINETKFSNFKLSGIRIINCSNIIIYNNTFNSNNGLVGICILHSNASTPNSVIIKDNYINSGKFCVSAKQSCGNDIYIDNECGFFSEDNFECTQIHNQFFKCINIITGEEFSADYNNISEHLCNHYK